MEIRRKNITAISYIQVSDYSEFNNSFLPPVEFNNEVIEFLKMVPVDLLQLSDSLEFLELCNRTLNQNSIDFSFFYTHSSTSLIDLLKTTSQLTLVFLDFSSEIHKSIFSEFKNSEKIYFHFRNLNNFDLYANNTVLNHQDFVKLLIERQDSILKVLQLNSFKINPSVNLIYKDFNPFFYFIPTRNNYFLLNRIIGNFAVSSDESIQEINKKNEEEAQKARKNQNSFERQHSYLSQINNIDFFQTISLKKGLIKLVTNIEPKMSPLILILPFNNPDIKGLYKNDDIIDLIQTEQTENYISNVTTKKRLSMAIAGSHIVKERIAFLDNVSFLHSSFAFSPVLRLPIQGKSIYRELSFFRSLSFSSLSNPLNRKKLRRSILQFGNKLSKKVLSPNLQDVIKKRDGQIVAITDLPIEWLTINNIPLIFTHDVCRLPETSLHGLMSIHAINKTFRFSITTDTITKTLVILGNDEDSFKFWHDRVYESSIKNGFAVRQCLSLKEVKHVIHTLKPEILIFDCHGGVDDESKTTFLKIGNEVLDGKFVIENEIYAPIVFISACGTAPTYGTYNIIANAFFEAGCLSVTSTYIPIAIDSGSFLYLRILEKLPFAIKQVIHKNWLEFICHIIRTSTLSETYLNIQKKYKISTDEFVKSNSKALLDSLVFSERRRLYSELDEHIQKLTSDKKLHYSETIPEFLLYSNLGRADLILFKDWEIAYTKKNKY